jgi:hypothetical protein
MAGGGVFQPVIDLNRTPVAGDKSSGHSKAPRARAAEDLPDIQRKTLEIQQRKLDLAELKERTRAKELELKAKQRSTRPPCLPRRARS